MRRVLLLTTSTVPTSLLLGAIGVVMFDVVGLGLNVPVFTSACFAAVLGATRAGGKPLAIDRTMAGAIAVGWSCVFAWRASPALHSLAGLALATTLYIVYLWREFGSLSIPVSAFFTRLPPLTRAFLRGPVCAVRQQLNNADASCSLRATHTVAVARGLILSVPLLVLFGWLLISADARFAEVAWEFLALDFVSLLRSTITFGVCFWIAIFLLRARTVHLGGSGPARQVALQPLEVITVLIALDALLALYIAVQLTYFVGGDTLVRSTQSLTYAGYARRGFFELVAVGGLTVPVLLCGDWLCEKASGRIRVAQRFSSLATTILVALVGCSAAHRLLLYIEAYGLTEQRLYAAAVLSWVIVMLAWIAWTVLRGRRERFLCGALVSALCIVALLVLANPDARIAKINLSRAAIGQPLDVDYLLSLSDDAVPAILGYRNELDRDLRLAIDNALLQRALVYRAPAWRSWNWARHRANRAVFNWPAAEQPDLPRGAPRP
ncbi:MAG: DUF4173 domain-containing protein [Gammaproteobacteria bacterium]|nr:DUF4173 domain-containing protein [Gammaproteobacteria bacterium]